VEEDMPLEKEQTFHIEEYKALREEIKTRLKDRLEFNRWGMIGIAGLYSYIFANPTKPLLFFVPAALSLVVGWNLYREQKDILRLAKYIRLNLEPWLAGATPAGPGGFEKSLRPHDGAEPWLWWPISLWVLIFLVTLLVAFQRPWLLANNWL
jgi:hypothetical protein